MTNIISYSQNGEQSSNPRLDSMQDFPSSDFDHGLDQHDCGEPSFGTLAI